ncbi:MAG: GTP-binding protein, partial [Firmicutes bacterium]|nr:GTP-binding protein [Bacillota bacterium]
MQQIKLYVLTGFLGSGKTTMLKKLLKRKAGVKVGVIQNEFGKVSIDGEILSDQDIQMTKLSNGSIFCTCQKLNFVQALADMSKQGLDELYVESSGLGDPSNLLEILDAAAVLMTKQPYEICGVICLVDAVSFLEEAAQMEALAAQIVHSNLAV